MRRSVLEGLASVQGASRSVLGMVVQEGLRWRGASAPTKY